MKSNRISTKQRILNKTKRVICIYLYISRVDATINHLAKRYKVNERSIQRDLKLLKEAGAKVDKGDWGYYVRKI